MTSPANRDGYRDVFSAVYGDWQSPSRAILARAEESRVSRLATETLDELSRVMQRVGNICQSFELGQSLLNYKTSCGAVEYVKDMAELEDTLKDQLKRKRYQDHVTVFIVGFENACSERTRLLQQVNEFFVLNAAAPSYCDRPCSADDVVNEADIDTMMSAVARTLETTQQLIRRLDRLHHDALNSVKRSNQSRVVNREKKKLEKSLHKTEADVSSLSEVIVQLQREIADRDDRVHRQVSLASSQSSITKSTKQTFTAIGSSHHVVSREQSDTRHVQQVADVVNIDITDSIHDVTTASEYSYEAAITEAAVENLPQIPSIELVQADGLSGIRETGNMGLTKASRDQKGAVAAANKPRAAVSGHGVVKAAVVDAKKNTATRTVARQPSTATLSSGIQASVTSAGGWTTINVQSAVVVPTTILESPMSDAPRSAMSSGPHLNTAANGDTSTHAHGYTATSAGRRSTSKYADMPSSDNFTEKVNDTMETNDDETSAQQKISELEDQLLALEKKSQKKTNSLKAQFRDHKKRWLSERELLLGCIEQSQKLQSEADNTLVQMEAVISDYEQLDSNTQGSATVTSFDKVADADDYGQTESRDTESREPGDGQVSVERSSSDGLTSSSSGLISLRTKHRSMLEHLKSRAEQTRASSVGFQLLASRDSPFLTADIDEPLDDEAEITHSSDRPVHDDDMKHLTTVAKETPETAQFTRVELQISDREVVQLFVNIYESAVGVKCALKQQSDRKDLQQQEYNDDEITFDEQAALTDQLKHWSAITLAVMDECKRDLTTNSQTVVKPDFENDDNCAETDAGKEQMQLASSMGVPPSRVTSVDGAAYRRSSSSDSTYLSTMMGRYQALEKAYEIETTRYHDLLNHKTMVIDEMQRTIDNLKHELGSLQHNTIDLLHYDQHLIPQSVSPIMFTRLDMERNSTTMKKAMIERKIGPQQYETAVKVMDEYNSLPSQRWAHLTRKYVSHRYMTDVLDQVRQRGHPDVEVSSTLSKMVALHNGRMRRYSQLMNSLTSSRTELADKLMETLMSIEQESGIFLIKPMFSWRGRPSPDIEYYQTKKTRPNQPVPRRQTVAATSNVTNANISRLQRDQVKPVEDDGMVQRRLTQQDSESILGVSKQPLLGQPPQPMWAQSQSMPVATSNSLHSSTSDELKNRAAHVPRMLELDMNRILINQNYVSAKTATSQSVTSSNHPVTSASSTRSYVGVNRVGKQHTLQRSLSATGVFRHSISSPVAPSSSGETQVLQVTTPTGEVARSSNSVGTGLSLPGTSRSGRNPSATPPLPPIIVPAAVSPEEH